MYRSWSSDRKRKMKRAGIATSAAFALIAGTATISAAVGDGENTLMASASPDLAGAAPLSHATLSGDVYIYISNSSGAIQQVRYFVDDASGMSQPISVATSNPFMLSPASGGAATQPPATGGATQPPAASGTAGTGTAGTGAAGGATGGDTGTTGATGAAGGATGDDTGSTGEDDEESGASEGEESGASESEGEGSAEAATGAEGSGHNSHMRSSNFNVNSANAEGHEGGHEGEESGAGTETGGDTGTTGGAGGATGETGGAGGATGETGGATGGDTGTTGTTGATGAAGGTTGAAGGTTGTAGGATGATAPAAGGAATGATGAAGALSTAGLADGTHFVMAEITSTSGKITDLFARFMVNNGGAAAGAAPTAATAPAAGAATATQPPATGTGADAGAAPAAAGAAAPAGNEAAAMLGWGQPQVVEEFDSLDSVSWYDSPGHQHGNRSPGQASAANSIVTLTGASGGLTAGGVVQTIPSVQYGRWEVRMQVEGQSCWRPVLLLWPTAENWPVGGEVDFAEFGSDNINEVNFFLHYGADNSQTHGSKEVDGTQWNNFAVEWTSAGIRGYVNGEQFFEDTDASHMPPGPMHPTIQLDASTGCNGDTKMNVDWMKYYAA
jgi:hypothetical protein